MSLAVDEPILNNPFEEPKEYLYVTNSGFIAVAVTYL